MKTLFVTLVVGMALPLSAADSEPNAEAKQKADEENEAQRRAFQGRWEIASVETREPLSDGQELPALGTKLKFEGIPPRSGRSGG